MYHYHFRHTGTGDKIDPVPETTNSYARLGHERYLAEQVRITGNKYRRHVWYLLQVLTITEQSSADVAGTVAQSGVAHLCSVFL
ncbi:hypothetical protein O5623_17740 [Escherichia coli]|nr:hypothetical protein [Escherichia coli]